MHAEVDNASSLHEQSQFLVLEYTTTQPKVVNPQVLSRLIKAGAQIVSLECETRSLEDVYASVMRLDDNQQMDNGTGLNEATYSEDPKEGVKL